MWNDADIFSFWNKRNNKIIENTKFVLPVNSEKDCILLMPWTKSSLFGMGDPVLHSKIDSSCYIIS